MIDASKKCILNPNQGYKTMVKKLRSRYNVSGNLLEP